MVYNETVQVRFTSNLPPSVEKRFIPISYVRERTKKETVIQQPVFITITSVVIDEVLE